MPETRTNVTIPSRFRGPPGMGNGGYVAGLVAGGIDGAARTTLRLPAPLDVPLTLVRSEDGKTRLLDGERLIAEAEPASLEADAPDPVGYEEALEAAGRFRWKEDHAFPGCFVCGPHREARDGLHIHPGGLPGREVVAAGWIPDASVAGPDGRLPTEIVSAALDCPSFFGIIEHEHALRGALLGQITTLVLDRPRPGDRLVVLGWPRGREGRKLHGGAAVFAESGDLIGKSHTLWIEPREGS